MFREAAAAFAEVTHDTVGSTVARVAGTGDGPSVAVVGHIDEIGLIVHHIDDDGFLWFTGVGGWDPIDPDRPAGRDRHARRRRRRRGRASKPSTCCARTTARRRRSCGTCTSTSARATATRRASLVRIGDVGVIAGEPVELPNGRLVSRAMDNRLGCFVAFEAARLVAEAGGAPGDVYAAAVAQEEITFAGARTTAYSLRPDIAIVVDVTFATDQPGIDEKELGKHEFGSGPVLTRGSTLDPQVFELLLRGRRGRGHPVHRLGVRARTPAPTPTRSTSRAPASRPAVVSVPLRYMHSPVEMVQLDDVENTAKLIAAFARRLEAGADFRR